MGRKGDFLELLDAAPVGVATLTGSLWRWTHHERSQRAMTELARGQGAAIGFSRFGGPVSETSDEHLRVWLDLPGRWRIESDDHVDLRDGARRWVGGATQVTEFTQDATTLGDTVIGMLVMPGGYLLGALRFGEPAPDRIDDRPCLRVDAKLNDGSAAHRFNPLHARLGGITHTYWIDEATGIVLRHVGLVDDEPCSIAEFTDITINPPLTDLDFGFVAPPGTMVERQVDRLVWMAEQHGADLTGVDQEDPRAVQEAIHAVQGRHAPSPEAQRALRTSKHVPVGDPPEDEDAARRSIEHAFSQLADVDDTGESLVNVQSGHGLAGPLREAQTRVPGAGARPASLVVDDVKFLRPDEAVVWFSVEVDGARFPMVNGREGRAVKIGDRWLIEHATIVDLIQFAGVTVRPTEG